MNATSPHALAAEPGTLVAAPRWAVCFGVVLALHAGGLGLMLTHVPLPEPPRLPPEAVLLELPLSPPEPTPVAMPAAADPAPAVAMIHRADPLPAMPPDMRGSSVTLTVPVNFALR